MPRNAAKQQAMDALKHIKVERDPVPRPAPPIRESARRKAEAIAPGLEHIKIGT